jgi:transcriptional regulator with XRE-family HTH domain
MNAREAPAAPLYELVERTRQEKGWTKSQLARKAGVRRMTIERWRTAPRTPLPATVNAVADALGIDRQLARERAGLWPPMAVEASPDPSPSAEPLTAARAEEVARRLAASGQQGEEGDGATERTG